MSEKAFLSLFFTQLRRASRKIILWCSFKGSRVGVCKHGLIEEMTSIIIESDHVYVLIQCMPAPHNLCCRVRAPQRSEKVSGLAARQRAKLGKILDQVHNDIITERQTGMYTHTCTSLHVHTQYIHSEGICMVNLTYS